MSEINECAPIVIFPMEVECSTINPTTSTSTDGSATLIINGGTAPYTILWDIGNSTETIRNLVVGSYSATIVDYYGDYSARTTCVLTAQNQPTTTPPEPTPTPIASVDFCMTLQYSTITYQPTTKQIHFNQITTNQWKSDDNVYTIELNTIDNQWVVTPSPVDGGQVVNTNTTNPPLIGWKILGGYGSKPSVKVLEGACVTEEITSLTYTVNQPTCQCDGAIIINDVIGGTPPYQYSKDGGINYQAIPIFENLCGSQTLTLKVKDANNLTFQEVVTINPQIGVVTYVVELHNDPSSSNNFYIDVTPQLPAGASITFNLVNATRFAQTPNTNVATWSWNMNLLINNVSTPPSSVTTENYTEIYNCGVPQTQYTQQVTRTWSNITITNATTSINGAWTSSLNVLNSNNCNEYGTIWNLVIDTKNLTSNISCGDVQVIYPTNRTGEGIYEGQSF